MRLRLIDSETANWLREIFNKELKGEVKVRAILGQGEYDKELRDLLLDLSEVDQRIKVKTYDYNSKEAKLVRSKLGLPKDECGNRQSPLLFFEDRPNLVYMGSPFEQEFRAFLSDLIMLSKGEAKLTFASRMLLDKVDKDLDILVFVTPTCPYCPDMVHYAHKFAYHKPNLRGIMVEAYEYPELADCYRVSSVPRNVIKERDGKVLGSFVGKVFERDFAEAIYLAYSGQELPFPEE